MTIIKVSVARKGRAVGRNGSAAPAPDSERPGRVEDRVA